VREAGLLVVGHQSLQVFEVFAGTFSRRVTTWP
jgi:hypothetical protein